MSKQDDNTHYLVDIVDKHIQEQDALLKRANVVQTAHAQRLAQQRGQIEDLEKQVENLQEQLKRKKKECSSLQNELTEVLSYVTKLEDDLAIKNKQIQD